MSNFDASEFSRAPIITVSSGVALARALLDAAPKKAGAAIDKAKKKLQAVTDKAGADLADRNRALGVFNDEDSRDLDNEADRAWGGLRLSLSALAMLDHDAFPNAKAAAEMDTKLFAGGMEFLKADYPTQASTMSSILRRIDDDDLAKAIDALVGKDFLKAIRSVQPRYEAMVSERLRRDKATGQNLLDATRGLQAAIVNYAQKLIGGMDEDDAESVEDTRKALLPIANHRDSAGNKRTSVDVVVATPNPTTGDAPKPA